MEQVFFYAHTFALSSHLGCRCTAAIPHDLSLDSGRAAGWWLGTYLFLPNREANRRHRTCFYVSQFYCARAG
jgi:hypothetical protein